MSMHFSDLSASNSIELPMPEYGYTVSLTMQIKHFESECGYSWHDNGIANDSRILKIPGSIFTEQQYIDLSNFFLDQDLGRSEFMIDLGVGGGGFYPFGPDLDSAGVYRAKLLNRNSAGFQIDPWKHFASEFSFAMTLAHGYSYGYPEEPQGDFQIGPVGGLMFPQDGFKPVAKYGYRADISNGGLVSVVDSGKNIYETEIEVWANLSNAAKLIYHIQNTIRAGYFTMICGENYWPFDIENGDSGQFNCKLISDGTEKLTVEVKHVEYDQFRIPLKIWMQAAA